MTEDFYMKVGLAGTGWRAQMYVRVMKALGECVADTAVWERRCVRFLLDEQFPGKG